MNFLERLKEKKWEYKKDLYLKYIKNTTKNNSIDRPEISVIIISNNIAHKEIILNNVETLRKNTNVPFEIIFVDNGVGNFKVVADIEITLNEDTGAYLARNIGAVMANAPWIMFLEDDGIVDKDILNAYYNLFNVYDIVAARGVYLNINNNCNKLSSHYFLGREIAPYFISLEGNCIFKTTSFFEVGGWDDNIRFGHGGIDISYRFLKMGINFKQLVYTPFSIIHHDFVKNEKHLVKKIEKQMHSLEKLSIKYPELPQLKKIWDEIYFYRGELSYNKEINQNKIEIMNSLNQDIIIRYEKHPLISIRDYFLFKKDIINTLTHKEPIYIFGTGENGRNTYWMFEEQDIKVTGFIDNNKDKQGDLLFGKEIYHLDNVPLNAVIIVASQWYYEIVEQLKEQRFNSFYVKYGW